MAASVVCFSLFPQDLWFLSQKTGALVRETPLAPESPRIFSLQSEAVRETLETKAISTRGFTIIVVFRTCCPCFCYVYSLFLFIFFFSSHFNATSVLKHDTLTRISGGSLGPRRFQFKGDLRHASPENAPKRPFLGENRRQSAFPGLARC